MAERHTRGGLNANSDRDASWQARRARTSWVGGSALPARELEFGYAAPEELDGRGWSNCWCHGELCDTTRATWSWLGKEDGMPHPKTKEELALRVEKQRTDND